LFGLQISTSRVATVTSLAIASRSWRPSESSGTLIARAPLAAARCGYIENDGHAYTISAPGSSSASPADIRSSHDPLPTATRPGVVSKRFASALRSRPLSGSG
jgi:hypothetical protein